MTTPPSQTAAVSEPVRRDTVSRRFFFGSSVALLVAAGVVLWAGSMRWAQAGVWDWINLGLFVVLFSQIAFGFALSLFGLIQSFRQNDPSNVMDGLPEGVDPDLPMAATAIVLPVYNEEIERVLQAVETMWKGLEETGRQEHFDVYILSDSNRSDNWVREECAWLELCRRLGAFGRIFYRKRRHTLNRKSGNVADFCRRWGKRYRYMIVLDADSIMTGKAMARLVQAMEKNPTVGLIQTVPRMVLGDSLFRRVLQFTLRVYGGIFSAGSHYWALDTGSFWGHNAIIRLKPFMEHCALPELPEKDPSKRRVLSHDTVEAALMRRANVGVCLAYAEDGSYEEGPPNLTDMLKRDRRWCQGNLQHVWFLFARQIHLPSRLHIFLGIMSYAGSLLWLLFLLLNLSLAYARQQQEFLSQNASVAGAASLSLLGLTLVLLFVPKVMGFLSELPQARQYGGVRSMSVSVVLETLLSIVFAPILMLFHAKFVIMSLLGLDVRWTTQNRSDVGLTVTDCVRDYGSMTVLGILATAACAWWLPAYLVWVLFITVPWMLSIPLVWWTSRPAAGVRARAAGLFLTPEETAPPAELQAMQEPSPQYVDATPETDRLPSAGLVRTLLDPCTYAIHISLLRHPDRQGPEPTPTDLSLENISLLEVAENSPDAIGTAEQIQLLWDSERLRKLHDLLWKCPSENLHPDWRAAMERLARESDGVVPA